MRLDGKVAVVTGATSGIGLAAAERFVAEGATVYLAGRRQAELDKATTRLGPRAIGVAADVTVAADLDRLFDTVARAGGGLDILVASAGMVQPTRLEKVTEDHFDRVFDLNARATVFTVQRAAALMRDGGSIVLIGSTAGESGLPGYLTYAGTKAAIRSYARTLTAEFRGRGIRVNVVTPGPIDTDLIDEGAGGSDRAAKHREWFKTAVPLGRMGRAEEVAAAILFVASDEGSFVAGSELVVDGGISQI